MQSTRIIKMSQQRHSQMATLTDRRRIRHTPIDRTADRPILLVAADGIRLSAQAVPEPLPATAVRRRCIRRPEQGMVGVLQLLPQPPLQRRVQSQLVGHVRIPRMQNNRTAAEQVAWPPPGLVEPLGWVGLPVDEPPPPNEFVD